MMERTFVSKIEKYLLKEENVLWYGKSDIKKLFDKRDIFFVPLSIVVGILILRYQADTLFLLFSFYLIIGRFIVKIRHKSKVIYVLTNKRILIIKNDSSKRIITRYINKLSNINISINKKGIGTIRFGESSLYDMFYGNTFMVLPWISYFWEYAIFYDISDAKKVYELIQNISKKQLN